MKASKHSRQIVVNGLHLRWWYRFVDCPCCGPSTLIISDNSRKGSQVCAHVSFEDRNQVITPATAAKLAQAAMAKGWVPGQGSGQMMMGSVSQM
jgi:hypothetical protein